MLKISGKGCCRALLNNLMNAWLVKGLQPTAGPLKPDVLLTGGLLARAEGG